MYCPNCGHPNPENSKFCMKCGTSLATAGPTPPGPMPPGPTPRPAPMPRFTSRTRWLVLGIGGLVLLAGGFILGIFLVRAVLGMRAGDEMLLALPQRDGEYDLSLVGLGDPLEEGDLLFEDILPDNQVFLSYREDAREARSIGGRFGGFVPSSRRLLLHYLDDDEALFHSFQIGDEEAQEQFSSNAFPISGVVYKSGFSFFSENRDDLQRCYGAQGAAVAQRLGRGARCFVAVGGEHIAIGDEDDDGVTLSLLDKDGRNETLVLDEVEDVLSYRVSDAGDAVAYVQQANDLQQQVHVVDIRERTAAPFAAEGFNIASYGFLPQSAVPYAISEDDDGNLRLYVGARAEPVASAASLQLVAGASSDHLYYMTGEDDDGADRTIFVYDVGRDTSIELITGDDLQFSFLATEDRLIIKRQNDDAITFFTAAANGDNLVEIFDEDDLERADVRYVKDARHLFIFTVNQDAESSLFAAPVDGSPGFYLVEEWNEISLLNLSPDGDRLVLWAVEDAGDRRVLYSVTVRAGGVLTALDDDADNYVNAVFTPNGRDILFTADTGNNRDDMEVMRVDAAGEEAAELLYEEAEIADVRWSELNPFRFAPFFSPLRGVSFCPGAPVIAVGQVQQGATIGGESCYRLRGVAGQALYFQLNDNSNNAYALALYDAQGAELRNTGRRAAPSLIAGAPQDGIYFLKVFSNSASASRFNLLMQSDMGEGALLSDNGDVYLTGSGAINLYDEPNGRIIGTEQPGVIADLGELAAMDGEPWYYIYADDGNGWVRARNLTLEAP